MVRTDIPLADQLVQVGHACFDAGTKHGKLGAYMVLLEVGSEFELKEYAERAKQNKIKHVMFYETDPILDDDILPMGHTAFCTQPISGKKRLTFADCVLWNQGNNLNL